MRLRFSIDSRRGRIAIAIAAVLFAVALWLALSIGSDRPTTYESITDHFKYGSIGSEPGVSLLRPVGGVLPPLSVFTALPSICPEKLPGGYGLPEAHCRLEEAFARRRVVHLHVPGAGAVVLRHERRVGRDGPELGL